MAPKQPRSDGRQALLVYMNAELVRDLKKAAIDKRCNVYEIVEMATRDWLSLSKHRNGVGRVRGKLEGQ